MLTLENIRLRNDSIKINNIKEKMFNEGNRNKL